MTDRIFQAPPFYSLILFIIPIASALGTFPPVGNTQLNFIYTALISVLFFFSFLLWEEFLSLEIKTSLARKVLTLLLLLSASIPGSLLFLPRETNVEFLLLLCLVPAFLAGVHKVFYQKKASLFSCAWPGILIALIEPVLLIPQTLICLMLFPQEKERSFLLFTTFSLPPIFLNISQYELTGSWFSPEFIHLQSKILEGSYFQVPEILFSQSLGFISNSAFLILYILLWTYIILRPATTGLKKNLAWAIFIAIPACSFLEGGTFKAPLEGSLVTVILSLIMLEFPSIRYWFRNSLNISLKIFFLFGLFFISYPFFQRMIGDG